LALRSYWPFVAFVILVYAVGLPGGIFTDTGPWFQSLHKPSFTPPNWVIPIAWNVLFLLIGLAGGLMYFQEGRRGFFTFYGLTLSMTKSQEIPASIMFIGRWIIVLLHSHFIPSHSRRLGCVNTLMVVPP